MTAELVLKIFEGLLLVFAVLGSVIIGPLLVYLSPYSKRLDAEAEEAYKKRMAKHGVVDC